MQNVSAHRIELYPPEVFRTLLQHEINRSRRYGDSLTLIDLLIETDPVDPEVQRSAEVFIMNLLSLYLRDADIPCKQGNEFLILMPSTSTPGARTACERIRKLMDTKHQMDNGASFKLETFIGMVSLLMDHPISSEEFSKNASLALQHARANHLMNAVAFSEIVHE